MNQLFRPNYQQHEPGRNEPCLCGSSLKFKKCCGPTIKDFKISAGRKAIRAFNSKQYEDALTAARQEFSWYLTRHWAHTEPWVKEDPNSDAAA